MIINCPSQYYFTYLVDTGIFGLPDAKDNPASAGDNHVQCALDADAREVGG